jgi:hypothetical protein
MKRNAILRAAAALAALALPAAASLSAQTTFQKFVAIGDSLPAGHEANCTVRRFQLLGASALIAQQLGISDFQQPLLAEAPPSNPLTGYPCLGAVVSNGAIGVGIISQEGAQLNGTLPRPFDNLGFNGGPRVKDFVDLRVSVPGRSDLDNYAARVLRNVAGSPFAGTNVFDQANALNPDLILYWVGNNDVLAGVSTGVVVDGVTLTPLNDFVQKYQEGLNSILASGRTIVTVTLPDVTSLPLYTTLPRFVLNPITQQPIIVNGQPVPLLGSRALPPECPVAPCPLPEGTLIHTILATLLMQQGVGIPAALGGLAVQGSGNLATALPDGSFTPPAGPLSPGVLLYADETALILERTAEINAQIRAISSSAGTVLFDAANVFQQVAANGYTIGGITLTKAFLSGGLFSADGVHPTQIGYAIAADEIIKAINAAKGTAIPRPNIAQAIFTPNVPNFGAASVTPGFAEEAWMAALPVCAPMDPAPADAPVARQTRVVSR